MMDVDMRQAYIEAPYSVSYQAYMEGEEDQGDSYVILERRCENRKSRDFMTVYFSYTEKGISQAKDFREDFNYMQPWTQKLIWQLVEESKRLDRILQAVNEVR